MRKNKALALALVAAMTASMTPITAMADETEGLTSYYTYQTAVNEMETFCVQNAQNAKELQVLTNCIDGLLSMNTKGELILTFVNDYSKIYSLYGIVSGYRYLTYSHG